MASKSILQPSSDIAVHFRDGRTGAVTDLTVGEAITVANSLGYDCVYFTADYWSYYSDSYYSILCFNINNLSDVYIANNDLFSNTNQFTYLQYAAFSSQTGILLRHNNSGWYAGNNVNLSNFFSGLYTYDNISYSRRQTSIDSNLTLADMLYIGTPNINLYINNVPPVQITEAGAGSGYIGNSLLSNKKMVGYNVPTSSDTATKTETINEYSETPVSGKPKSGNGYVKITFLRSS